MEVYVLDELLRRELVVDQFESLIWTERYAAAGDFELVLFSNPTTRRVFTAGTYLALNESHRVMVLETVEDTTDSDGKKLLTCKGRSLEIVLMDRVARRTLANMKVEEKWIMTGKPAAIARHMFDRIVRAPVLDPGDKIDFLRPGSLLPPSYIPEPQEVIVWEQEVDTLYNAIKNLCELYDLGFRLLRNFDTSQLYFDIYSGNDRTNSQTSTSVQFAPVVFSPGLENLQNTTEFTTIEDAKNVAYVWSTQGFEMVFGKEVDPEIESFERKVLLVKVDALPDTPVPQGTTGNPIPPTAQEIKDYLIQRGREELSKHRGFTAFDGEIDETSEYKYGVHYHLGDLVEMQNQDYISNKMRVTEQIFVSDATGERSYPTLSVDAFITPGSWLSWLSSRVWADLGLTEYWSNSP